MKILTGRLFSIRAFALFLGLMCILNFTPQPAEALSIPPLKLPWGVGDKDRNGNPIYLTSGPHGAPVAFACNGAFNESSIRPLIRLSGLDFNMAQGTSVLAAAGGWVVLAGPPTAGDPRGPNVVAIDHGDGFMTQYWHLSSVDTNIKVNHWISQGTRLGGSGISGTGQHLHLEFRSYRNADAPWYNRDSSPGLPYPAHGLPLAAVAPNGLSSNYVAHAEIRGNVLNGVNYNGTLTRGTSSVATQTICSNNVTVKDWVGAEGTVWASASGGTAAKVTGSTNGPPASPVVTIEDAWASDGNLYPNYQNAPRKTVFSTGENIRFWAQVNNHSGASTTTTFVWNTGGPRNLFTVNTPITLQPGRSWWYFTLGSVQSSAWGGSYAFRARVSTNGISSGLSQKFTINAKVPSIYIMLTWNKASKDLDAHLWGNGHIYFANPGNLNTAPDAALDVDDNGIGGMETIGISQRAPTVYTFAVYNWGNISPLRGQLIGVRVKSPRGWREYQVPVVGEGRWWNVFKINADGTITDVNTITTNPVVASGQEDQNFEHFDESRVKSSIAIQSNGILQEAHIP